MSNTRKAGRRERLLARKRPTFIYQLPVEDDTAALAELEAAKVARELADVLDDQEAAVKEADRRLARARKAVDACYEPVTLTALPPVEYERLAAEHPARDGKDEAWNAETFPRALFLACAPAGDDELTEAEWAELLDNGLSSGERASLLTAAITLNARWPSGAVPNE
jgi:hypothetical protein